MKTMINSTNHQENENKNHKKTPFHTHPDGYYQREQKATDGCGEAVTNAHHLTFPLGNLYYSNSRLSACLCIYLLNTHSHKYSYIFIYYFLFSCPLSLLLLYKASSKATKIPIHTCNTICPHSTTLAQPQAMGCISHYHSVSS